MERISEETRHKLIEIATALAISLLFYLLSFTSPYERVELLSLDALFNLRNLSQPIAVNPDVATIDIDDVTLTEEGRWQDWTRDKHARIVDIIRRGGGAMIGFDVFFSEESEKLIRQDELVRAWGGASSFEEVLAAFPDYDYILAESAKKAGSVYWGSTFIVEEGDEHDEELETAGDEISERAWDNLGLLIEKDLSVRAEKTAVDSILRAQSPQAIPIPLLIEAGRGVGFAQIRREADGVVRRYPTFIRCDYPKGDDGEQADLFPAMGLAMACDYLQVPSKNLKIFPGEYLEIPNAFMPDGSTRNLRIPINEKGEMLINWAGDYKDAFNHFSYAALTDLNEARELDDIKEFISGLEASVFDRPGELVDAVRQAFPYIENSMIYVACLLGAHEYEQRIEAGQMYELTPEIFSDVFGLHPEQNPDMYEGQKEVFKQLRINQAMFELLSEKPATTAAEASEMLGKSLEEIEDSHTVISRLIEQGGLTNADSPLYFMPPVDVEGKALWLDDLKGGVFFYGLTAAGTHDLNPTPFSPRYPMVGAIANVFNTIVTDQFITPMPSSWRLPMFLAIGIFAGYILSTRTSMRGSLFTLLFLVFYLLFVYWLFADRRMWIDAVGPTGIILFSDAAIVWYKFNTAEKKRKFIRGAFEQYLNPAVVEELAKNPDMLELGGKTMELTAFFSDVASFTTISEQLNEQELVELLNEYLTEMTDIVLKEYGNLDKYEGDAIMAFYGAPIPFPDHAARACTTALEMQEKLAELREKWKAERRPELTARIGINSGPMVVGNMGSRTRMDYTVMGDAVNLASRLEGVNKQYATDIMISEFTLEHCESDFVTREIDLIRVKGKSEPVRIYEVLARAKDGISDDMKSAVEHYSAGLEAYRKKEWEAGIQEFQRVIDIRAGDGPSLTYLKRCREYCETPPPDDWDGVYVMTTK
jgi:class 3 adenylate cyclase